ncbi:MAG: hypothetical protein JW836_14570 [Deltaproteobacteria bacterium]|nr:hypothetical protein [Deltaproteobacteria bacterium]
MKTYYSKKLKRNVTIPDYDDHTGEILEDRYVESLKAAISKLETLRKEIPEHGDGKITWPIVGDLQYINELLDEIIEFMGI